ncbi:NAD-binding protein, partial [Nocardia alni]|uniref:NAD-binding protein n=1 Tax=Nocardia alni TaxID=2815723 RepID=UPI001C230817
MVAVVELFRTSTGRGTRENIMRVVVAGGGLVGLTAAGALGRMGHEVTVVEGAPEIRAAGAGIGLWE